MRATLASLVASSKCYYDTLDVSKDASLDEIKKSFRRISKETHPDVATKGCPERNAERFKQVSNAYQTLSNPKERRRYDLEQQDQHWFRNRQHHTGAAGQHGGFGSYARTGNMNDIPKGPKATGLYAVLETMFRPRNFILGVAMLMTTSVIYNYCFESESEQQKRLLMQKHNQGRQLVEAWKNPSTGRWEQPAPWDPVYRRLQPKLEMVPREQVATRTKTR